MIQPIIPGSNFGTMTDSVGVSSTNNDVLGKMFGSVLKQVEDANSAQVSSNQQIQAVELGQSNDVAGALLSLQKADLQLQFITKAKDELVQGYQQIMSTQI